FTSNKLVLEFIITNTVPSVLLSNISVACSSNLSLLSSIPLKSLTHNQSGSCYLCFDLKGASEAAFDCSLNFLSQECDPQTFSPLEDGYVDRYPIDSVHFGLLDCIKSREVYDFH